MSWEDRGRGLDEWLDAKRWRWRRLLQWLGLRKPAPEPKFLFFPSLVMQKLTRDVFEELRKPNVSLTELPYVIPIILPKDFSINDPGSNPNPTPNPHH